MLEYKFFRQIMHYKRIQGQEPHLIRFQYNVLSFCFY